MRCRILSLLSCVWARKSLSTSMLQTGRRHAAAEHDRVEENLSFQIELRDLYLQQLAMEKLLQPEDVVDEAAPTSAAPATNETLQDQVESVVEPLENWTSAEAQLVRDFVGNHSLNDMLIWCFGDGAAWVCVPSRIFHDPYCGYFHGWLTARGCLLLAVSPIFIHILCVLPYLLIDVYNETFDDDEYEAQYGYSLIEYRHRVFWRLVLIIFPLEMFILFQLNLLQQLFHQFEAYLTIAILILTVLSPIIIRVYHKLRRLYLKIEARVESAEKVLLKLKATMKHYLQMADDAFEEAEGTVLNVEASLTGRRRQSLREACGVAPAPAPGAGPAPGKA